MKKHRALHKNIVNFPIHFFFLAGKCLFPLGVKQTGTHELHLDADVPNFMEQLILLFLFQLMSFLKGNNCSDLKEIEYNVFSESN